MNCGVAIDIGVQNFEKIRERNSFYVDKTDFIREWWENGADVTLITRPRRFGKTLNLSMLECFFSNQYEGRGELFEGLSIWKEEKYKRLQGTYPVIFLSFASIKSGEPARIKIAIKQVISNIYKSFQYMMESEIFDCGDRKYYSSVNDDMSDETVYIAINRLCFYLERYYGRKTILLLDEYDTPMQEAWLNGCWEEAVSFFRSFFNAAFKTNPHMERGLITGITRISKESIFSDLNNPEVITTTSGKYARYFGFTEQEVFQALDDMGFGAEKEGVKSWYDGFTFGSMTDIYNPWSIMSFMANGGRYQSYWADTSSNGLVNRLICEGSADIKRQFERLIGGKSILVPVDEQIIYDQLDEDENAVWSLLLAGGYLKVVSIDNADISESLEEEKYELALTNHEVRRMFAKMIRGWFKNTAEVYSEFIKALLQDDVKKMNIFMNKVALNTFSAFDSGNRPSQAAEPERFYHGFVLGMVVDLADRYSVKSNRESGYGRYDVMIEPHDRKEKAFLFEFKVLDRDSGEAALEDTAASALAQLEEKRYETELIEDGIAPENIRKYGFAFEGKRCLIVLSHGRRT